MTASSTHQLLVRDRQNLDRVAKHLRRDQRAFYGFVCAPALVSLVIEYLRETSEKTIPEPIHPVDAQHLLSLLGALEVAHSSEVISIHLSAADVDQWTALNWTREKLLRGGRMLLFMDTLDDLAGFHAHAPDAYSFRTNVFVVEGGPAGKLEENIEPSEPVNVRTARLLYELGKRPEEKAQAAIPWASALKELGDYEAATRVVEEALALIPRKKFPDVPQRRTRIMLYILLSQMRFRLNQNIASLKASRSGLEDIGTDLWESMASFRLGFQLMCSESPLGVDREIRQWSIGELPDNNIRRNVLFALAESEIDRGYFRAARERVDRMIQSENDAHIRIRFRQIGANGEYFRGHFRHARQHLLAQELLHFRLGFTTPYVHNREANILISEGELDAARQIITSDQLQSWFSARIAMRSGDISVALVEFKAALEHELKAQQDSSVFDLCSGIFLQFQFVPSPSRADLDRAYDLVHTAGEKLIAMAGHHPVWYDVLVPGLRAQMLSLYEDQHEDAMNQAKQAVSLARSTWKQALARSLRIYAQCLARAGRWAEMMKTLLEGMKAAREEEHLIELATLRAYDLAFFLNTGASKKNIQEAQERLENTFRQMDAPRIEGETWLEVLPYLPLSGGVFDVVPIAERIHDLFTDMPMPEPAARALEWLGDAHVARGQAKKAEGCYKMALAALEKHGLGLRVGVIREKLMRID